MRTWWWLPAVVTILIHLPLVWSPAFIYDDLGVIRDDPRVRSQQWGQAWTGTYITGAPDNLYRPLMTSSYLLQWRIHGDWPLGFRIVNLLAHAGVAALVYVVGRRLVGGSGGLLAGLLFAVHPIHVEVLGTAAYRTESFAALAILGSMAVAAGGLTAGRIAAMCAMLVAGLLSKEQALTIGPLVLLTWWVCRRKELDAAERRRAWILAALMLWITAGYLVIRESMHTIAWDRDWLEWTFNAILLAEGWDRVFFPIKLLGRYLLLMIWPVGLSIDYGGVTIAPQTEWGQPYVWAGLAGIGIYLVLLARWIRARRWGLVVCLTGLAMTYFLVSNAVIVIVTHFNERLFYLPSAFLLMMIGWALSRSRAGMVLGMALSLPLAGLAFANTLHWGDRADLYAYHLGHTPGSIRLHLLLGGELRERGELDRAAEVLEGGIAHLPQAWEIWTLSAEIEALRGNTDLARERITVAWEMVPDHSRAIVGAAIERIGPLPDDIE